MSTIETFNGLRVRAMPGLHEAVFALLSRQLPPPSRVLDLATGTGAFSLRLQAAGYRVHASDLTGAEFAAPVPFTAADLNHDFAAHFAPVDAIVAVEVIEHLENPWHFLRQCRALLAPSGQVFLTTPNIESPTALATLVRGGHFAWFSEGDYQASGHITPISEATLRRIAARTGFAVQSVTRYGDDLTPLRREWPALYVLARLLAGCARGRRPVGENLIVHLQAC